MDLQIQIQSQSPQPLSPQPPSLSQRLQKLPPELHQMILDKYRNMYLNKEITKKYDENLKALSNKALQNRLLDIGDFAQFNSLLQKYNYEYKNNFAYLSQCIIGVLEYYYSLNYYERLLIKNNFMNIDNNVLSSYENLFIFLEDKELSKFIDQEDIHSRSSGMWIFRIVMKFMFGSYLEKITLWNNLVENYF